MSSINQNNNSKSLPWENIFLRNTTIEYYINRQNLEIERERYINPIKVLNSSRILLINLCGFRLSNDSKIYVLKETNNKYQINMIMLNKTNNK